jgi:HlyD family secretion protein
MKRVIFFTTRLLVLLSLLLAISACSAITPGSKSSEITASGIVSATNIRVASEIGGKVAEIKVAEGDSVKAGDVLFRLDDQLLQAQHDQSQAAVDLAQTSVEAAKAQLQNAQAQLELTVQQARLQDEQNRTEAWKTAQDTAIDLPSWYFGKSETITATQAEVDSAQDALNTELANLDTELKKASNKDFVAAEKRLAEAQIAYQVAKTTHDQANAAADKPKLDTAAQERLDAAKSELDAGQTAYNQILSTSAAESVLEARARTAVARARLDNAKDKLATMQTGDQSLQVAAAQAGEAQAQTAVSQAQDNLSQAQAALKLVDLQLEKCTIKAPMAGIVTARNLEVGELVSAGSTVMTISQLNTVNLTVYLPENRYGQVQLGQKVSISVDSFPGRTFTGQVQFISDEAEYTPRNVQTVDGRKATVYAVKISVPNDQLDLKPGMPADVDLASK